MAEARRDYYEVLGVKRDADQKAIKDAFRQLALRYHPDRNKEPGAEDRFKEIAEAYAVLSDAKKRAEYDTAGFAGVAGFSPEDLFGGIDFEDIFSGLGFDLRGGEPLFERLFRPRRRAGPPSGASLEVGIVVPLERVASGGEERIRIDRPAECSSCRGSGAKAGTAPKRCDACEGSGKRVQRRRGRGISFQQITVCASCGGRGSVIEKPCPECAGTGQVSRHEDLTVRIPVGVEEGMVLRVPGHGLPSPIAGGPAGDLFVVVATARDPRFTRDRADLWRTETVEVADAVLGTEVQVPTLGGPVNLTIPPGTQPDTVLRLGGKGLPEFGGSRRGDLYVRIDLRVPRRLSAEERRLYERLRASRAGSAPADRETAPAAPASRAR